MHQVGGFIDGWKSNYTHGSHTDLKLFPPKGSRHELCHQPLTAPPEVCTGERRSSAFYKDGKVEKAKVEKLGSTIPLPP